MEADIKLIKKDTILPKLVPMDWDVVINGIPYYVVRIKGYAHTLGGKRGVNEYWAYPRYSKPTYETLIEFDCDDPVSWGIKFEPRNHAKFKDDECEARSIGTVTITRNGIDFYKDSGRNMFYAIDKARVAITQFQEHPLELNSIDFDKKSIGRKVWWRSEPAIIEAYIPGQACVILQPDGIDKFTVPAEFAEEEPDYYADGFVKTSILDKNIWWFRN